MAILVEVQAESVEGNPFEYLLVFAEKVESSLSCWRRSFWVGMVILVEVQAESVEGNPFEYLLLFTENVESNDFYKVELFDSEADGFLSENCVCNGGRFFVECNFRD